jgi:hypothetical protein
VKKAHFRGNDSSDVRVIKITGKLKGEGKLNIGALRQAAPHLSFFSSSENGMTAALCTYSSVTLPELQPIPAWPQRLAEVFQER